MRSLLQILPFGKAQSEVLGFQELVKRVQDQFTETIDLAALAQFDDEDIGREVRLAAERICDRVSQRGGLDLSEADRARAIDAVLDEIFGLGPLEPLLRNPNVKRIQIDVPDRMVAEDEDGQHVVDPSFRDDGHCRQMVDRMRDLDCCDVSGGRVQHGSTIDIQIGRSSERVKKLLVTIA